MTPIDREFIVDREYLDTMHLATVGQIAAAVGGRLVAYVCLACEDSATGEFDAGDAPLIHAGVLGFLLDHAVTTLRLERPEELDLFLHELLRHCPATREALARVFVADRPVS